MTYYEIIQNHIRSSVKDREINNVLHFTQLKNLPTIIKYGLMSYNDCDQLKEIVHASDADRFCDESVCVTVNTFYPKMFAAKRDKTSGPWMILALEPRLLWELECNFYPMNIGTREMKRLIRSNKKTNNGYAFDDMFEDCAPCGVQDGVGYREKIGLPYTLTTHPDAEIQVRESIPAEWITDIWIEDMVNADAVRSELNRLPGPERGVLVQSFEPRFKCGRMQWG